MHGAYILIYIHTGVYIYFLLSLIVASAAARQCSLNSIYIYIYLFLYSLLLEDEPAKVLALVSGQWLALAIWLPTCFAAGES